MVSTVSEIVMIQSKIFEREQRIEKNHGFEFETEYVWVEISLRVRRGCNL